MSRWKKYEDMTPEERWAARGMKQEPIWGETKFSRKKIDLLFSWDTKEAYGITLEKLNTLFKDFSEFSGIPVDDLIIDLKVESSYYDSYDKSLAFQYCKRLETDEEFEKRLAEVVIPHEESTKRATEKAKVAKAKRERKEYERLKTKFEGTS